MDQAEFEQKYGHLGRANQKQQQHGKCGNALAKEWCQCCGKGQLVDGITRLIPILGWLPKYNIGQYLNNDVITGLTVGIMVVPQGMAYATLAKVAPVYGLYSCFFSAFFYMFFGTSPHISIGTFAVASMMVGNVRTELVPDPISNLQNATGTFHEETVKGPIDFGYPVSPIMLTSALTFGVGLCQLIMALCRLSFLTNYISDPLVSGFTTGAAIHVLTSQIDKLIGVKIKGHHGPGLIIFMWRDLIGALGRVNFWTLGISAFGLIFLSLGRDYFNPWFKGHFRLPFPIELFLVIAAIIFSTLFGFKQNYGVRVVDNVPQGMPLPAVPQLDLLPHIWLNAFTISIISYIFVFSLSKIFAKKHKYKVDPNQELYAVGLCSLLSSFFPVYPFGASLSRSSLCEMTGAKTPLHALFSSALLLVVILWIGPLLEPLPMAILGCIVVISLKPLFFQFSELPRLWRISIFDFAIWLVAFVATAFLDITYGLAISVLFSIFTVVLKEQWPKFNQMGEAKSAIFRPLNFYSGLVDPKAQQNVQIWRFESPLHFANAPKLIELVAEICQQIASKLMLVKIELAKQNGGEIGIATIEGTAAAGKKLHRPSPSPPPPQISTKKQQSMPVAAGHDEEEEAKEEAAAADANLPLLANGKELAENGLAERKNSNSLQNSATTLVGSKNGSTSSESGSPPRGILILDCAPIVHIDSVGVDALGEMFKDARKLDVQIKFAAFSDPLLATFHRCSLFKLIPEENFFPSIQDALAASQ